MSTEGARLKRILHLGFWLIAIGLLINLGRLSFPRLKVYARAFTPGPALLPYTTILRETVYDDQGYAKSGGTYTWAVGSDGSRANRMEFTDDTGKSQWQLNIDLASGKQVRMVELRQGKSTTTYSDPDTDSWVRDPKSKCVDSTNGRPFMPNQVVAGDEDVSGYRTTKITRDGMTWWFAQDYSCAMVKFEANWGPKAKSEQELVELIPGEPSGTLFAVPDSFTEMAPSKLFGPLPPDAAQHIDERYYAHHVQE